MNDDLLNRDFSFSVSLCSNSAFLRDLQSDIKNLNSTSDFRFIRTNSKNILFQIDEDILRLCFSSLLRWFTFTLLPDDHIEVFSSNSDNSIHFCIKIPEAPAFEFDKWITNSNNVPDALSDKYNYFTTFRNSLALLEKHYKLIIYFDKSNNLLTFKLPAGHSPVDGHHSKKQ